MPTRKKLRKEARELEKLQRRPQSAQTEGSLAPMTALGPPRTWPIMECLVSSNWRHEGELVTVVVARESSAGSVMAGIYLVDLGCLGLKNTYARRFPSVEMYREEIDHLPAAGTFESVSFHQAARIVLDAIEYARSLGFKPQRDYRETQALLEDANPDAAEAPPLGRDGKPFFVNGPHDDVRRIIETLNRSVGEGNYHYMIGGPGDPDILALADDEPI